MPPWSCSCDPAPLTLITPIPARPSADWIRLALGVPNCTTPPDVMFKVPLPPTSPALVPSAMTAFGPCTLTSAPPLTNSTVVLLWAEIDWVTVPPESTFRTALPPPSCPVTSSGPMLTFSEPPLAMLVVPNRNASCAAIWPTSANALPTSK